MLKFGLLYCVIIMHVFCSGPGSSRQSPVDCVGLRLCPPAALLHAHHSVVLAAKEQQYQFRCAWRSFCGKRCWHWRAVWTTLWRPGHRFFTGL